MKRQTRLVTCDLAVIGTGIAGFAASLFARDRGLDVAQFGHTGAIAYTTGYLDLLGVQAGEVLTDPWAGLDALRAADPAHPLARRTNAEIRAAFEAFIAHLDDMGLAYTAAGETNIQALLPYGVVKPTLAIPQTMRPGVDAMAKNAPTLIVDFDGLQGFSGAEFLANLADSWPGLGTTRVGFPGMEGRQVFAEVMARALETPAVREALADLIRPLLGNATHVGLPAILGMNAPDRVRAEMERLLGVVVFEIPTIPPSVPGIRLREAFERCLPGLGIKLEPQLNVARVELEDDRVRLFLHGAMEDLVVEAGAAVLATGRFLSGGLKSDRERVFEPLIGLPVRAPETRNDWFRPDYLDPRGHALNRAGIETDAAFRPLGPDGAPASPRLFAAGAILAGQDWVRQRCGVSLAIASAHGAVGAASRVLVQST